MKKLILTTCLIFFLNISVFSETEFKTINEHLENGFKIVSVLNTDNQLIYTLQKKNKVRVCYMVVGTIKPWSCVTP